MAIKIDESPSPPPPPPAPTAGDLAINLDVEPRKPRLAWQGMERKEMAGAVPTQVVEIVRPGRAIEREGELTGLAARTAAIESVIPENRLISSALARSDPGSLARKNPGARGVTGASAPS